MLNDVMFRRLLDASDPAWRPLIALYAESFEDAQREAEAGIRRNLRTSENSRPGGHVVIAALAVDTTCVGGIIFSYLPTVDSGYVSYIFVRSGRRRQGIGTALLEEAHRWMLDEARFAGRDRVLGVFTEIQRVGQGWLSLRDRFHFWQKVAVLPLDVDWRYPPLRPDEPAVPMYLAYGSYGPEREHWYPRDIERVAVAIFEATYDYLPGGLQTLQEILAGVRRLPHDVPISYIGPGETLSRMSAEMEGQDLDLGSPYHRLHLLAVDGGPAPIG